MKYIDLLWALDILSKYYPRYYNQDLMVLAEDVWKWLNNELPEDSSTLIYLKNTFSSPSEALKSVLKEIQLLAGPFLNLN
jgi:hypothetical protein